MQRSATTYTDCVIDALRKKSEYLWFCFGGTTTPWDDDANPPAITPGTLAVAEPLFYAQREFASLARPVTQSEWEALAPDARAPRAINGIYYAYVADEDAHDEFARWLYVRGVADTQLSHPAGTIRIVGILSDLVPQAGYESATVLLPSQVSDPGKLRHLTHSSAFTLNETQNRLTIHAPIECR